MVRRPEGVIKEHAQGGEGAVTFFHILEGEELMGHGPMFAKVVVHPHSTIGYHTHVGNTEPYYILSGKGIFTDNDGTKTEVTAGDVCVIKPGQSHGMENPYDEPMEMIALIINEA